MLGSVKEKPILRGHGPTNKEHSDEPHDFHGRAVRICLAIGDLLGEDGSPFHRFQTASHWALTIGLENIAEGAPLEEAARPEACCIHWQQSQGR